jgi:2-oxo-4-hydroxy-4-carboxy-5-ureidoimidazoline decarboxylase
MSESSEISELPERIPSRLHWLNSLPPDEASRVFTSCCGSRRWADAMVRARPFADFHAAVRKADETFDTLTTADWKEAFAAHPKIGETQGHGEKQSHRWSQQEQSAAAVSSAEISRRLQQRNEEYYSRFGHIFIICATGKPVEEILASLQERMKNDPVTELRIAASEQRKITQLRLEKLMMI